MEPIINYSRIRDYTLAEGPGKRLCVWTQGCLIACPGCCNAAMQPLEIRELITLDAFCNRIAAAQKRYDIEGITFLGGEPFLQARTLAQAAAYAKSIGLTVLTFTGYTLESIRRAPFPGADALLNSTDVLIDGPYRQDLPDSGRNWVGSANQRFWYLTPAYGPAIETDPEFRGIVEIQTDGLASFRANGCPKTLAWLDEKN